MNVTEDREANVWVVTADGVDRFTDTPVSSVSASPKGLCSTEASSVLACLTAASGPAAMAR